MDNAHWSRRAHPNACLILGGCPSMFTQPSLPPTTWAQLHWRCAARAVSFAPDIQGWGLSPVLWQLCAHRIAFAHVEENVLVASCSGSASCTACAEGEPCGWPRTKRRRIGFCSTGALWPALGMRQETLASSAPPSLASEGLIPSALQEPMDNSPPSPAAAPELAKCPFSKSERDKAQIRLSLLSPSSSLP